MDWYRFIRAVKLEIIFWSNPGPIFSVLNFEEGSLSKFGWHWNRYLLGKRILSRYMFCAENGVHVQKHHATTAWKAKVRTVHCQINYICDVTWPAKPMALFQWTTERASGLFLVLDISFQVLLDDCRSFEKSAMFWKASGKNSQPLFSTCIWDCQSNSSSIPDTTNSMIRVWFWIRIRRETRFAGASNLKKKEQAETYPMSVDLISDNATNAEA